MKLTAGRAIYAACVGVFAAYTTGYWWMYWVISIGTLACLHFFAGAQQVNNEEPKELNK